MDSYLEPFMARGISRITIGKGERGAACRTACAIHHGVYLAAIGGAAALAAARHVTASAIIDWPELGMEAIRLVQLAGLPALVVVDSRGNDYYAPFCAAE
jgi:fumarate hydratase class I